MNKQIDFKDFVKQLSIDSDLSQEELEAIVFELFVHVRTNTECGLWVEVDGFGSFHPLWYEIKKHKDQHEDERIVLEIEAEKEKRRLEDERLEKEKQRLAEEARVLQKTQTKLQNEHEAREKEQAKYQSQTEEDFQKREELFLEKEKLFNKEIYEYKRLKKEEEAHMKESIHEQGIIEAELTRQRASLANEQEAITQSKALLQEQIKEFQEQKKLHNESSLEESSSVIEAEEKDKKSLISYLVVFLVGFILGMLLFSSTSILPKDEMKTVPKKALYRSFTEYEEDEKTTAKFYKHTIVKGDNLYLLSKKLYKDSRFWPLIFVENMRSVKDMDKVYPGEILKIPHIPEGSSAQKELSLVYIKAYKAYKRLGKDNDAHWLLYWGSQHINTELLDTYAKDISLDDMKKVNTYLKRFDTKAQDGSK